MPGSIIIANGKSEDVKSVQRTETFTGEVWSQMVATSGNVAMGSNVFMPCSRTHWHTHEGGQMLHVTVGSGWICDKGGEPRRIKAGDVIWAEPGTTHWHGADKNSFMSHLAVGIGQTTWHEEVVDDLYKN
ncbi:RmlC-like cupin domain-containing protein, partial [Phialemonium atrogriseum]